VLIRCPECKSTVSRSAVQCPVCGAQFQMVVAVARARRMARRWRIYAASVAVFGIVIGAGDLLHFAIFDIVHIGFSILALGFLGLVFSLAS